MTNRQAPPGRTSISWIVLVKPFGPHHLTTWCGSVHIRNTRSRGASNSRVAVISRPAAPAGSFSPSAMGRSPCVVNWGSWRLQSSSVLADFAAPSCLFCLNFLQVLVEAVEALLPEPPIVFHPVGHVLERPGREPARPPLGPTAPGN